MTSANRIRFGIAAIGLLLLAFLLVYHVREATKFVTWAHTGFRESQMSRISEAPVIVTFRSVVTDDFDRFPYPDAGDTVVSLNGQRAAQLADIPYPANTPLQLEYLHNGDTLVTAFAMPPQPRFAVLGIGFCVLLRFLVSMLSLAVGLWALQSRHGSNSVPVLALYSFAVAAMVSLLYYFFPTTYATFSLPFSSTSTAILTFFSFLYCSLWLHLQCIYPRTLNIVRQHPVGVYAVCYLPSVLLIFVWLDSAFRGAFLPALADARRAQLLQVIIATIPAFAAIAVLAYRYLTSTERLEMRQLRLIVSAAAVGIVINDLNALISHVFPVWYNAHLYRTIGLVTVTFAAMLLGPISFAYAFRKFRLMDVEAKLRRGTRYTLVTGGLAAILIAFTYGFSELVLTRLGITNRASGMVLASLLALAFVPAQKRLNRLVEKHFYPERTRLREMLHGFLEQASTLPDRQTFWNELQRRLRDGLKVDIVYPALPNTDSFPFASDSALIEHLRVSRRTLLLDEALGSGRVAPSDAEQVWLHGHGVDVLVPLVRHDEFLGILAIGARTDEEDYDAEELDILNSLAPQIAVAVENLRLLEDNIGKKRLEHELALARKTQEGFLPRELPSTLGLEVAATCHFCLEVAGDYYDVIPLSDGKTVLAIGDVSGKGAAAALLMASLQAALHTAVPMGNSLADVVAGINNLIHRNTPPEQYITFFVAVFDPVASALVYVNAGHNAPMLLHRDSSHHLLEEGGPVLGCLSGWRYAMGTVPVVPGDMLFLYTDGVSEAMNFDNDEFGEGRILSFLQNNLAGAPREMLMNLEAEVVAHHGSGDFEDDFTLLVARVV